MRTTLESAARRAIALVFVSLGAIVPASAQWVNCTTTNTQNCTTNPRVGIGLDNPLTPLVVHTGSSRNVEVGFAGLTGLYIEGIDRTGAAVDFSLYNGSAGKLRFFAGSTERMHITAGGKVYIGDEASFAASEALNVVGNIAVTGNINAKFQDLAEWVPASEAMEPGTVVVLNPDKVNEVMPSSEAYDVKVAGVVSARPGMLLGESGASKATVATTGRVKVRVDASRAPVRIGDLLVTSDRAGCAMKSEPVEINGRKFHQPGTVIGKALEPLASGEGEILVLLSLQ